MATLDKVITKLDTSRGAPMGRSNVGVHPVLRTNPIKMKVYNCYVPMNGAYDTGGAYWGHGAPLRVSYTKDLTYINFYRVGEQETITEKTDEK